ncbi:12059_t:CDS:1, partial [Ambispora gerdemannii]
SPYEFKLLYRGSRDGFAASKFHELCGSRSQTVVVVKINQTERIIGGYNPSTWGGGSVYNRQMYFISVPDAFIFSISDGNVKFSRSISGNQIAYNPYQITYGPYFYNDLCISDQCDQNTSSWYRPGCFNTPNNNIWDDNNAIKYFQVDEFEVFCI